MQRGSEVPELDISVDALKKQIGFILVNCQSTKEETLDSRWKMT